MDERAPDAMSCCFPGGVPKHRIARELIGPGTERALRATSIDEAGREAREVEPVDSGTMPRTTSVSASAASIAICSDLTDAPIFGSTMSIV